MADSKISNLSAATSLLSTDEFVIASSGTTKKITAADMTISIGGSEMDYAQRTSDLTVTGTSEGGATTVITGSSVSYNGSQVVCIEFFCPLASVSGGSTLVVHILEDATVVGWVAQLVGSAPLFGKVFRTPAAGSHTYTAKSWKTGGTATIAAGAGGSAANVPAFLRITQA